MGITWTGRHWVASAYRIGLGLLAVAAMITQFVTSSGREGFDTVNFFSYFTNLSNILGAGVFLYSGISRRTPSLHRDLIRGAAVLYLGVTGIVYHLLLTEVSVGIVVPWVNAVLHSLMPLAIVVDWLLFPPVHRLQVRHTLLWLVFPISYLIYSLIRGAITGWYPYPFLDPGSVGGYAGVTAYALAIAAALAGLMYLVRWLGNRQHAQLRVSDADAAG